MSTDDAIRSSLQVPCERCGAKRGDMCTTKKGEVTLLPHVARRQAYIKAVAPVGRAARPYKPRKRTRPTIPEAEALRKRIEELANPTIPTTFDLLIRLGWVSGGLLAVADGLPEESANQIRHLADEVRTIAHKLVQEATK